MDANDREVFAAPSAFGGYVRVLTPDAIHRAAHYASVFFAGRIPAFLGIDRRFVSY